MKKYMLEITVFICGAIGMILELIAARVLSPYVGKLKPNLDNNHRSNVN